ncbi:MAG TPA: nuclear transport factor 2 family protein [Candidatus Binataceae bacterium]|nr:nuclear transport factor 2 family protein [Candidatus Binataceae bacterium]
MSSSLDAAKAAETSIRQAEQEEAEATLRGDVAALDGLWTEELLAYSSSNLYAGKQVLLGLIGSGALRLLSHRRITLQVIVDGDRALAVGNEHSQFDGPMAGRIMLSSYLNVWTWQADRWRLFGRHVGLITLMKADPTVN